MIETRRRFLKQAGVAGLGLAAASRAARPSMALPRKGLALVVGLTRVAPQHYAGWDGRLLGPESDVETMSGILAAAGFKVRVLRDAQATRAAMQNAVSEAVRVTRGGDIFALYYTGQAGQLPDVNGDEADGLDETFCLYDGQFLDDEVARLWHRFPAGVRILSILDCGRAGSLLGNANADAQGRRPAPAPAPRPSQGELPGKIYQENKQEYDPMLRQPHPGTNIAPSVLTLVGARPDQVAKDTPFGGLFTVRLKRVWDRGRFQGNYRQFYDAIAGGMPKDQTPVYRTFGTPNPEFEGQRPFTI